MVELAIDTGMVCPLAVRSTVSRASGADVAGSNAPRCGSSMKLDQRLAHEVCFR